VSAARRVLFHAPRKCKADAVNRMFAEVQRQLPGPAFEVEKNAVRMQLSVTAGERAMPAVIGWHPWFRKPDLIEFTPTGFYPRDAEGIALRSIAQPPPGPWDDCFLNDKPIFIQRMGQRVRLVSSCRHWVVYDETAHATCFEPQSGPPDAFSLEPTRLAPRSSVAATFALEWT